MEETVSMGRMNCRGCEILGVGAMVLVLGIILEGDSVDIG